MSVANLAIPTDFTVETWVKPTATQKEQILLSKQVAAVQANQFRLGIDSGRAYFMMTGGSAAGDLYGPNDYVLTSPIVAAAWTHLAVTKSGATFVLYVNGVSKVTHTANAMLQHTGTALFELASTIASDGVAQEKTLDGTIDEIRIWDVARPGAEILADMGKTISPAHAQYAHLVSYYKLDDGAGTVATDTKGLYPGTLVNAPTWVLSTAPTGM